MNMAMNCRARDGICGISISNVLDRGVSFTFLVITPPANDPTHTDIIVNTAGTRENMENSGADLMFTHARTHARMHMDEFMSQRSMSSFFPACWSPMNAFLGWQVPNFYEHILTD